MIYITSDWHFNHNKSFLYEPRGFKTIEEMNEAIIKNHNEIVNDDDDVYCLGDCMLGDNTIGINCISQLNGRIHIICGNHDTDARRILYADCPNVVEVVDARRLNYKKYHFFLSHYPCLTSNVEDGRPPHKVTISLCGHFHTKNPFENWSIGRIYNCEVDAHNCKPKLLDEIIEEINNI